MALNTVTQVGRLTQDPDVKSFDSGKCVAKFDIAVRRPVKDGKPDYFSVEVWNKTAEVVGNYCRKGSLIGVEGSLAFEGWEDKNTGAPRDKPVIKATRVNLLGSRADNQTREDF